MTPKAKLIHLVFTAFKAARPMGLGFLHTKIASALTEDELQLRLPLEMAADLSASIYVDYLCGRMMKTRFSVSKDGVLSVEPNQPRSDYQSWGDHYPTGDALIAAAVETEPAS